MFAKQCPVCGFDQVDDIAAHELRRLETNQRRRGVICKKNLFIVDDDDFGQGSGEVLEQAIAPAQSVVTLAESIEQTVDRMRELGRIRVVGDREAMTDRGISRSLERLLVEACNANEYLPARHPKVNARQCRHEGHECKRHYDHRGSHHEPGFEVVSSPFIICYYCIFRARGASSGKHIPAGMAGCSDSP